MTYIPDPDAICHCQHVYGYGIPAHATGHQSCGGRCMECGCEKFQEDTAATFANWMAEDATWDSPRRMKQRR